MVISCLYVQTVIRQCFCFPNSQWGATAHDNSREIMEGHRVIFRVIVVPGADTVIEVDSREMDLVSEVEVDLTKVQMLADQGLLVKLSQEMPQDVIIVRNQATYCDSVIDAKKRNVD